MLVRNRFQRAVENIADLVHGTLHEVGRFARPNALSTSRDRGINWTHLLALSSTAWTVRCSSVVSPCRSLNVSKLFAIIAERSRAASVSFCADERSQGSRDYFRSLEEHYGGRRLLKQLKVSDRGERDSPPRPGTDREAHNAPTRIRLVVPTLQLFQHIDIPTVHVVAATNDTFKFINRRMGRMRHVGFVPAMEGQDAQMVLIDDSNRARVFSRAAPTFFNTALRKTDMFKDIVSLAIGDFGIMQDWTELFATPVPSLETLTIIVSPARPVGQTFVHVFDVAKTTRWSCQSLRGLRFSAKEPLIDLGPQNGAPLTVSAAAVVVFLRRGLLLRTSQLPELFLDGVVFAEGGSGPEVRDLRGAVSRLVLRR